VEKKKEKIIRIDYNMVQETFVKRPERLGREMHRILFRKTAGSVKHSKRWAKGKEKDVRKPSVGGKGKCGQGGKLGEDVGHTLQSKLVGVN